MKQFLMCVLLLSGVAVSQAQPKMSVTDVKSSAAAVFHYIVWRSARTSSLYIAKSEQVFVTAFDGKDRDITAAASIKYLRDCGYNAYAGWRASRIYPYGGYSTLSVTTPEIKAPDLIRWQIIHGYRVEKDSEFDGSAVGYWVTMKKEKNGWRCVRREVGWSAG